jgi:hypothetical protein
MTTKHTPASWSIEFGIRSAVILDSATNEKVYGWKNEHPDLKPIVRTIAAIDEKLKHNNF